MSRLPSTIPLNVGLTREEPDSWLALPVVVVEGELFRLSVRGPGKDDLEPVDWYRVRWHEAQAHTLPTAVDVVRAPYLAEYAKEMRFSFGPAVEVCDLAWADAAPKVYGGLVAASHAASHGGRRRSDGVRACGFGPALRAYAEWPETTTRTLPSGHF